MECRLSHSSGPWSCQIKIRWEFSDAASRRLPAVEEIDFGPRLFDKSNVEIMLRRAQAAVLNPSRPLSTFLEMNEKDQRLISKDKNQYQFSRNVVCVDLAGPDLADLSFVDLPGTFPNCTNKAHAHPALGIVQNADDEVIKLVEDLVSSYIAGEKSVILVTLPMSGMRFETRFAVTQKASSYFSDDIENQKAARLATLADPRGSRTIGTVPAHNRSRNVR